VFILARDPKLTPPRPPSPAISIASSAASSDSHVPPGNRAAKSPLYSPTVPTCMSGSPKKEKDAPLDPSRPHYGMTFRALHEAIHFVQEFERRRGYRWKKGETTKNERGMYSVLQKMFLILLQSRKHQTDALALLQCTFSYPGT
jgi:hypothetical protein